MSDYRFNWFALFRLLSPLIVLWLIPLYPDLNAIGPAIGFPLIITHLSLFMAAFYWAANGFVEDEYIWWIKTEDSYE